MSRRLTCIAVAVGALVAACGDDELPSAEPPIDGTAAGESGALDVAAGDTGDTGDTGDGDSSTEGGEAYVVTYAFTDEAGDTTTLTVAQDPPIVRSTTDDGTISWSDGATAVVCDATTCTELPPESASGLQEALTGLGVWNDMLDLLDTAGADSYVTSRRTDTIAGREADCVTFDLSKMPGGGTPGEGEICADVATGATLRVRSADMSVVEVTEFRDVRPEDLERPAGPTGEGSDQPDASMPGDAAEAAPVAVGVADVLNLTNDDVCALVGRAVVSEVMGTDPIDSTGALPGDVGPSCIFTGDGDVGVQFNSKGPASLVATGETLGIEQEDLDVDGRQAVSQKASPVSMQLTVWLGADSDPALVVYAPTKEATVRVAEAVLANITE